MSGDPDRDIDLSVPIDGGEGLQGVLVLLLGFRLPCLDGRQPPDGAALVPDDGIVCYLLSPRFPILSVVGEVGRDRYGKIERHDHSSVMGCPF